MIKMMQKYSAVVVAVIAVIPLLMGLMTFHPVIGIIGTIICALVGAWVTAQSPVSADKLQGTIPVDCIPDHDHDGGYF